MHQSRNISGLACLTKVSHAITAMHLLCTRVTKGVKNDTKGYMDTFRNVNTIRHSDKDIRHDENMLSRPSWRNNLDSGAILAYYGAILGSRTMFSLPNGR